MIFQSAANDFPFCTDLFRPLPEQNCNQVARQIVVCLAFFPYLCSHENENRRNDEETTPCHHLVMALHVDAGRFGNAFAFCTILIIIVMAVIGLTNVLVRDKSVTATNGAGM